MKIEYMMKVIGHKREKKEGEKRVKHHGREMQQERVEDGLETRKKRFSDEVEVQTHYMSTVNLQTMFMKTCRDTTHF